MESLRCTFKTWWSWCTTVRVERTLCFLWICPGLPICYILRESIAWVVFMSAYAIIMGHRSTWVAARAEAATEQVIEQIDAQTDPEPK